MKIKTRSILQELNEFGQARNIDALIESRALNVIKSAINVIQSMKEHYDPEQADELERRLVNSIKGQDASKFTRGMKKIVEAKK